MRTATRMTKGMLLFLIITLLIVPGCSNNDAQADDLSLDSQSSNTDPTTNETTDGSYNGTITLQFAFGERTGKFKGTLVDGLPEGYGEFTTESAAGEKWTYKGEWKDGHFNGEGQTAWESGTKNIGTYINDQIVPMSEIETKKMIAQPEEYKDRCVEVIGEIFTSPEYYDGGVAVQMHTDIDNYDDSVIVYLYIPDLTLNVDDIIKVTGFVGDVFEGVNAFGAELSFPTIHSSTYEIMTYEDLHPIIASSEINQTQTQLGYSVTLQKVEITEEETRVYVRVENNGAANFNLYSFNTTIIQNGKQYEEQSNWDADYPEVQTDLYPGVTTEGIITYPSIEAQSCKIILEGSSDNYSEDINDFIFNIEFE